MGGGRNIRGRSRHNTSIITVSMLDVELEWLDDFVDNGFAPSRSELVRFCILYSLEKIQELHNTQTRIVKKSEMDRTSRKYDDVPNVIYVKNGGIKYQKYEKVEQPL